MPLGLSALFFGHYVIDRRMLAFLAWAIVVGLLVNALEITGFVLLGGLIGDSKTSDQLQKLVSIAHIQSEHLIVFIFGVKLLLGLALTWVSTRLMKRLLLTVTHEVASRHLTFCKVASTEQGDLTSMMRNCLTLIAYLDGNYFRQLSILCQEMIMLLLVATYMIASYGWSFALVTAGLFGLFVLMRLMTGRRVAKLGHDVVQANAQIVRAINELHRMRKELNVWGAVPSAVHRIEFAMNRMMAPNYQSELILSLIRPSLEFAAVAALVSVVLFGSFSRADIIIIGLFVLRTLPSMARLQVGVTAVSTAAGAKRTVQGVLNWA
jgi:ABC-type multidrug transport system fused ATPase/permease subunit